ncbi:MAG: PepSY domain-containing protein [Acidobacteriota bacterium]|nr:MAG: PepSY domain-containing protein [Acidobacteriota bacterium]
MKNFRKVIFWGHLLCGVIAGVIILVMSVTGVLLTYERQMLEWAETRNHRIEAGAARMPIEALLAKVREVEKSVPASIYVKSESDAPVALSYNGGRTVYVNPYTGAVLGEGATGLRRFFRVVTDWHRWLGQEGVGRATGRAITGACNLAFLFIVVSGFYLWFPRVRTWPQFRNILWFRRGLAWKAQDFNWHNVIGFWSLIPLFIVVLSGVTISYSWAGNLVYRAVGEKPPAPPTRPASPPRAPGRRNESTAVSTENLNLLWARAEGYSNGWKSIRMRLPNKADEPLAFVIDHGTGGQPQKRGTLTLDRRTGETVKWETFSSLTRGRQARSFMRFAHTGEYYGIIGQTIAGIVSLGGAVLVWTGLALALRRFRAWKARQSKVVPEALGAN